MKRKIEIIVETDQLIFFRGGPPRRFGRCERCAGDAALLTPEAASFVSRRNLRAIYRGIEGGLIHFVETPEGSLLVCLDSVRAAREL